MVYAIAVSLQFLALFLTFSPVSADAEVHKNPLQHIRNVIAHFTN